MNKEALPWQWKGDKTDSNNYQGMSLLLTVYKILSNILLARLTSYVSEIVGDHQCGFCLARLTSYVSEIVGDHQCGFCHNRSNTAQIFNIQQIPRKNGSIM
jgi:pyrrolidone-carboxylate peptidase